MAATMIRCLFLFVYCKGFCYCRNLHTICIIRDALDVSIVWILTRLYTQSAASCISGTAFVVTLPHHVKELNITLGALGAPVGSLTYVCLLI